jgi:hypothetical protein
MQERQRERDPLHGGHVQLPEAGRSAAAQTRRSAPQMNCTVHADMKPGRQEIGARAAQHTGDERVRFIASTRFPVSQMIGAGKERAADQVLE